MHFRQLPIVLQDIICQFAWKCKWKLVEANMEQLSAIKSFNIPPIFFRNMVLCANYTKYVVNPLDVYIPVFDLSCLFNKHRIHELLYKLDFRKRNVRCLGSRWSWIRAFDECYENILRFGMFYKMLLSTRENIWTPTYRNQLTDHGADHLI